VFPNLAKHGGSGECERIPDASTGLSIGGLLVLVGLSET
jgi:hypothetical protein